MMRYTLAILWLTLTSGMHAQDTTFCDPSLLGQARSKGLQLTYDRILDHGINGTSAIPAIGDVNGEVRRNRRLSASLKLPVLMKPAFKLIIGAKYEREQYAFEKGSFSEGSFLENIDELPLTRTSVSVIGIKPFHGNKYLIFRVKGSLNRELQKGQVIEGRSIKYSAGVLGGIKTSPDRSMALGVSLGYNLGRTAISPLVSYNHTFNEHWGLESLLPISVVLRHNVNDHNLVYLQAELKGDNYDLDLDLGDGPRTYYLERSEFHTTLRYEREIHDWLWVGVEGGVRYGIELDIVDSFGLLRGDRLLNGTVRPATTLSMELFLVAPRKWSEKK